MQTKIAKGNVTEFLSELFVDGDPGKIILVTKGNKGGLVRAGEYDTIDQAAKAAVTLKGKDVYLKINRMDVDKINARNSSGIGGKKELQTVRVIGMDIDTAAKDTKYPPRQDVLDMIRLCMPDPSMVVASDGTADGGLHVYWILDEPITIDDSVTETSVEYINNIARQLREAIAGILPDYQVDHCENIERVFRVAGLTRADGKQVEILGRTSKRHKLADLIQDKDELEPSTSAITNFQARDDSPISDYLESMGIYDIEDYLSEHMGWQHMDGMSWERPDAQSGMHSGEVFKGKNGEWGLTVKTSGESRLKQGEWYSLARLFTAWEHGGDWKKAAAFARQKLSRLQHSGPSAAEVFKREYSDFDKWQMTDRAAAAHCYENLDYIVYVPEEKEWRVWNGSAWAKNNEAVMEIVQQLMVAISTDFRAFDKVTDAATKEKLKQAWGKWYRGYQNAKQFSGLERTLMRTLYKSASEFGEDPFVIHTPHYCIDLRTGQRRQTTRDDWNIQTTIVDPDEDGECDRWLQFLDEIMNGDSNMVAYLKRVAGYCLTGLTSEQVMFLFHGSGQNGKGVFTKILEHIMGDYATILDQAALTGKPDQHPTAIAGLHRARLALSSETDIGCTLRESLVKWITSNDTITARRMREDYWTFKPTHKLILSTNIMPTIKGSDEGIWRRLRLIKFGVHFTDPDRSLETKLRMEAPGILNWMIEGAREYLAHGLQDPQSVMDAGRELRKEMDIVEQWLEENCERADQWHVVGTDYRRGADKIKQADFWEPFKLLYDDFRNYCRQSGYPEISKTSLGIRLTEKKFHEARKRVPQVRKQVRARVGIKLISPF